MWTISGESLNEFRFNWDLPKRDTYLEMWGRYRLLVTHIREKANGFDESDHYWQLLCVNELRRRWIQLFVKKSSRVLNIPKLLTQKLAFVRA